jgi:hypothetical protein
LQLFVVVEWGWEWLWVMWVEWWYRRREGGSVAARSLSMVVVMNDELAVAVMWLTCFVIMSQWYLR